MSFYFATFSFISNLRNLLLYKYCCQIEFILVPVVVKNFVKQDWIVNEFMQVSWSI